VVKPPDDRFSSRRIRQHAQQFGDAARLLEREREEAATAVPRILAATERANIPALVERPELRTCGAVDRLAKILSAELTNDPVYAEALARLAVALVDVLPPIYSQVNIAQIRSHVWKDLGKVLSFLARQDEAIDAYDRAEAELGDQGLEHDLAIVKLNRAITYQEVGRYEEALSLLTYCREIFRDFNDVRLGKISAFYEGLLLQRMRRYREAREIHLLLITSNTTQIGEDTTAALHNAIGYCSIELGEFDYAEYHLSRAITLYRSLRQPIEALKGELGRGRLLIRRGLHQEGVAALRKVRHQFLKSSLAEEAGICGLEMVEGMLRLFLFQEAETLARTIMSEFLAAHLNARAIEALGHLSEAIAMKQASPDMAIQVREYVLSLRTTPEREYTAAQL